MIRLMLFISVLMLFAACEKQSVVTQSNNVYTTLNIEENEHNPYFCNNAAEAEAGQMYLQNGKTWLWGGRGEQQDFNVSGWSLKIENLGSGLGRELIEALVFPAYEKASSQKINDEERVIVVKGENEIKVFTYDLLSQHELVNELIDDQPILVGYCPLADLAVVYERTYCDTELFFALSGYTYIEQLEKESKIHSNQDSEIESFILWDRNTESLWYPYQNIGVSGKMNGQKMNYYNRDKWELITYGEALETYGMELNILSYHQPKLEHNWTNLTGASITCH